MTGYRRDLVSTLTGWRMFHKGEAQFFTVLSISGELGNQVPRTLPRKRLESARF